jgi:Tfp pilus assembly protein PilF
VPAPDDLKPVWLLAAAALILVAAAAIYANSLSGAFVFDDVLAIRDNPTIKSLWPIWPVFSPPTNGETVSGRPLLNLSLAVNYAIGGLHVQGYHVTNVAIHVAVALLLFGVVRRTLRTPRLAPRFAAPSTWIALAVALVWTVHPIQTEAVTYIVQRAESLVSLFYVLVLYCVIRGATGTRSWPWYAGAVAACLLGMASKEIMVTAPVVILLYDWTFLADSPREIFKRRWGLYLGMAVTWLLLIGLVRSANLLGKEELDRFDVWSYARSQPLVILHYLRLCFWPHPLCIDYEWPASRTAPLGAAVLEIVLPALAVGGLVVGSAWGLLRQKPWGFLGAWFFLILAPTSSVVPLGQLAFEHRIYLAMAAVITLVVAGGYVGGMALVRRGAAGEGAAAEIGGVPFPYFAGGLVAVVCIVFGLLAHERNRDYGDAETLWIDTLQKAPHNARAHSNFGTLLCEKGRVDEGIAQYQRALEIRPTYGDAGSNLGEALRRRGRLDEAIVQLRKTIHDHPNMLAAICNLAVALHDRKRDDEVIAVCREGLSLHPESAELYNSLGLAYGAKGQVNDEVQCYQEALKRNPDNMSACNNLGIIWYQLGTRTPEAAAVLQRLAWILATSPGAGSRNGQTALALAQRANEITGGRNPVVLDTLAAACAESGRFADAVRIAEQAQAFAAGNPALIAVIAARGRLYAAGQPFHEAN